MSNNSGKSVLELLEQPTRVKFVGSKRSGDTLDSRDHHQKADVQNILNFTNYGQKGAQITITVEGPVLLYGMSRQRKIPYATYEVTGSEHRGGLLYLTLTTAS